MKKRIITQRLCEQTLKTKQAFTLAEVLIALTIIGVVSALTIPTLVQKTNKQEYVSALQKAYSTLSQATNMIIAENGSPKCDDGGWACSVDDVYNKYRKYLSNAKECSSGTGCFNQMKNIHYKYLDGYVEGTDWDSYSGFRKLVLADGAQIAFDFLSKTCDSEKEGTNNVCARIRIDVNGAKKPNIAGRDLFFFLLTDAGLNPEGCGDDSLSCRSTSSGWGCACKVLREGKMDY